VAGKVTGPGSGPPGGGPIGGSDESRPNVGGPRFADKLGQTDAATDASKMDASKPAATAPAGGKLGQAGKSGKVELTSDLAADKQLGVGAPAATREKLRVALENAVADDPLLADKIRGLG
jgi:hypothetical protein